MGLDIDGFLAHNPGTVPVDEEDIRTEEFLQGGAPGIRLLSGKARIAQNLS